MTMSGAARRAAGFVVAMVLPVLVLAQTPVAPPAASETQLLTQIASQPRQIGSYLDLAKLYFDQHRYDDATSMLNRATQLVDEQRNAVRFQPSAPAVSTQTTSPLR